MSEKDELLQQQLSALEAGKPLDAILNELPGEDSELASLVVLAASVRDLPHPKPVLDQAKAWQRIGLRGEPTLPAANRRTNHRAVPGTMPQKSLRWTFIPALALAMGVFLFAVGSLFGLGIWFSGPRNANYATLIDASGGIEVASSAAAEDWRMVENGDRVKSGERIRTRAASTATLVYFDGSRTTLGSNADLTLTNLSGDWGDVLRVALTQNAGKISSSVVPLRGKRSNFTVLTPSGAASVHGTKFNVAVGPQGKSRFSVNTGKVLVSNPETEVFLTAGQAVSAVPGQPLDTPAYQFTLRGVLTANQGSTWIVSGVAFTVLEETVIEGEPQPGDSVLVEGRVLEDGAWIADSIELDQDDEQSSSFTGILESMESTGDGEWKVGGWTFLVNDETELGEGLSVGSPVRVDFTLLDDGRWLALRIEALTETPQEPTLTPTATPDPAAQPSLSFEPDELEAQACGSEVSLTGVLRNEGGAPDDYAADVELGYQLIKGAEFVEWVELDPSSWDTIAAGEQVSFNVSIQLTDEWSSVQDETEVKLRVFVVHETNRPDHLRTRLTATLKAGCDETPTPTLTTTPVAVTDTPVLTPTATLTVTPTPVITGTATSTPVITATVTTTPVPTTGPTNCTGAQPHPTGTTLALRYGVTYEEIMSWFCQGFGFGEIDLAYSLSLESGVPVANIFEMKSSGMGWGEIKEQLSPKPTKDNTRPNQPPKPTKPPKKNK